MTALLTISKLIVRFGAIEAVRGFDLTLARGTSTAIVGTNGAGKSTTLLALAGALPRAAQCSGTITLAENASVSMVPERGKIFPVLTVAENLTAANRQRARGRVGIADVYEWFPRLAERRTSLAGNLSGGEQQMLAIGMALLGSPVLLLLDEPTLGLAVPIIERMCDTLGRLRKELDLTVLCAEAEVQWLDRLAENTVVISRGKVVETLSGNLAIQKDRLRDLALGLTEPAV
jgi:branched-chain amino acid transport system ATP-binding protein